MNKKKYWIMNELSDLKQNNIHIYRKMSKEDWRKNQLRMRWSVFPPLIGRTVYFCSLIRYFFYFIFVHPKYIFSGKFLFSCWMPSIWGWVFLRQQTSVVIASTKEIFDRREKKQCLKDERGRAQHKKHWSKWTQRGKCIFLLILAHDVRQRKRTKDGNDDNSHNKKPTRTKRHSRYINHHY